MNDAKSYPCPQCGTQNSGTVHEIRRGLKCAQCGTGYIPIKIEERSRFTEKESNGPVIVIAGFVLALALLFGFISIWLAVAVAIIALLVLAIIYLSRIAKK